MGKINLGRVILGGIVAGIVADIIDFLVDDVWLAGRWTTAMSKLGQPASFSAGQLICAYALGIIGGLVAVWIYAAMRPRFGAGVKTAVYAGLAVWVLGTVLPNIGFMLVLFPIHFFGRRLTLYTTLGGLVEVVVGTIAGAALYKEAD